MQVCPKRVVIAIWSPQVMGGVTQVPPVQVSSPVQVPQEPPQPSSPHSLPEQSAAQPPPEPGLSPPEKAINLPSERLEDGALATQKSKS